MASSTGAPVSSRSSPAGTSLPLRASGWRPGLRPGKGARPPSAEVSKSSRIWPLMASIFCPAMCTAILRPSETMRSSESGCSTASLRRSDSSARPICLGWMRFSRSLTMVWMAIRSEKEYVGGRNQFLALPASQLALGKTELAQHVGPRVLLFRRLRQHATILTRFRGAGPRPAKAWHRGHSVRDVG
jgi:hypothetical protein